MRVLVKLWTWTQTKIRYVLYIIINGGITGY